MIRFGPAGNDVLFYQQGYKSSIQAPKWLHEMGLTAFEICFGRGSRMSSETAKLIGDEAKKYNIEISVHAPYYINMAKPEYLIKNYGYFEMSIRLLNIMGGRRVVVHLGSQGEFTRAEALRNTRESLKEIIKRLDSKGYTDFLLCIETMGKHKQIGTYEEICELCSVDKRVIPTLDFGHINCTLQGELKRNPQKIAEIISFVESKIGKEKLHKIHIHWSAIEYAQSGERWHVTLEDERWNFPFEPLARIIRQKKLQPVVICESDGIMAQDALKIAKIMDKTN